MGLRIFPLIRANLHRMGGLRGVLKNRARERRGKPQNSAAIAKSPWLSHIKPIRYALFRAKNTGRGPSI
jgi:hypothetical protein